MKNKQKKPVSRSGNRKGTLRDYLQRKHASVSKEDTETIRLLIQNGQGNVYELAKKFGCVPTQVAGIKARLSSDD